MRVLVTGGAGFIGSILCEHLLAAGHSVTVLDNLMYGQAGLFHLAHHPKFELLHKDARDPAYPILKDFDVIIPLAAIVGAPACDARIDDTISINSRAVLNIVNHVDDQLIIYPNTNSGYGAAGVACTEESPMMPISLYGQTKCASEETVLTHPNSICLRLATVFGCSPRMRLDLLVNDFTYRAYRDGYLCLYQPHFKRNYVHIRDVADCFLYCIEHVDSMVGQVYNLGNDEANCTKLELAERIQQHLPKTEIYVSEHGEDPDKRDYLVSNEKLRQAGFEAKRSLDEGIEELIKGFKMMGRGAYSNV